MSPCIGPALRANHDTELRRAGGICVFLIGVNVLVWAWAFLAFRNYPFLLGTAFVAYTFGLRHAVDADHIAAIDNVTRKLMQEGKRPAAAGLFFALGHSTVVVLASAFIAVTTNSLESRFPSLKMIGGVIGTSMSAFFLFVVAGANMAVLRSIYRTFRRVRGGALVDEDLDHLLAKRGLYSRLFRRLFRLVARSWHMYPVGILFGLGFDTATEIGLFGISAAQASSGRSIGSILIFPALFAAGMSLVDMADSLLMVGAYGWAFAKPVRKLYYNLTMTFISVLVALIVAGIETFGMVANELNLTGPFWNLVVALNGNFGTLGYLIVAVFVASWVASIAVYRVRRYDRIDMIGSG
jgi:nickel/cobalt transporter (NiCoT) family protein